MKAIRTGSTEIRAYMGLILTFVIWGSLYVVSTVLLASVPTMFVAFTRYAIAFLALSVILKVRKKPTGNKKMKIDRKGWRYVLVLGFFGYAVSIGLQLVGTKYAGSTVASLINSLNPVSITLVASLILKEKLTANKVTGILLSILGVYLIIGTGSSINPIGVALSLASVISWAFVSVFTSRGLSEYDTITITRAAAGVAAVVNFFLFLAEHFLMRTTITLTPATVAGLVYIGVVCTGVAHVFWNNGLAKLPASNCSALYPVQPLTSAVMGAIFFHETMGLSFFAGAALIVAGVLICLMMNGKHTNRHVTHSTHSMLGTRGLRHRTTA